MHHITKQDLTLTTSRVYSQVAMEIYRKDQKSHHEQSIASDLTRGLLRKVFRETVLESSKQVISQCSTTSWVVGHVYMKLSLALIVHVV